MRAAVALLLVALAATATASDLPTSPTRGEVELMRDVIRADGVDTRRPRPGLSAYAADATSEALRTIGDRLRPALTPLELLAELISTLGWNSLVMITIGVLAITLAIWLKRRLQRRAPRAPQEPESTALAAPERSATVRWEARLSRHLAAGEVAGALEAIWWSLAVRLVGVGIDPSWTSRELIQAAGRRDLLPSIRRLDRMTYARARPTADDVRRLWHDLEEQLR